MFANFRRRALAAHVSSLLGAWSFAAAQVIEIDEVISREVGIHVGGISTPDIQEIVSREASLFIENGREDGEVASRELSVVTDAPGAPPQVTGYAVTPSPDGSSVVLDWSTYNPWAVGDVAGYRIYLQAQPFSDVSALVPFLTVPGETLTATLAGLPAYQDHFIAIVAVDALGNSNPAVVYSAAYILTKEVVSREVSVAFNAEPQPAYREVVSREVSVVRDNPGAPAAITDFLVTPSPDGTTVTLDWSSYNQWVQQDVDHYRVYYSDTLFTELSGVASVEVAGENFTHTFHDLAPWVDHYFAIVPVDALGASDPVFHHGAAYVLMPEVISREVAVFMGQEPPAPPPVTEAIPVANFSFENPDIANFIYWGGMSAGQRGAFAWTGAGNNANTDDVNIGPALFNNGGAWNYANVPDGSQAVSIQGDASITLEIDFTTTGSHTLTWSAASRTGQVNPYVVKLDGSVVSPVFSTSNTSWQSNSVTFAVASAGTHTITFAGLNTAGGDNSVGIDAVSLSRFDAEGSRPFGSLRELVSREVSAVRPDGTTPAPVTFAGSGFTATTARTTYSGISLDWRSYNEWSQQDVERYRIYVSASFFSDVSGMEPHAFSNDGTQFATITVPAAETIYYIAVVAEDSQGNFDPAVYPVSGKSAVGQLGDVANLTALPSATSIAYSWDLGGVGDELADFVKEFRIYPDGATTPVNVPATSRSWTATGLLPVTQHSVRVTTVDHLGVESSPGAVALATTLPLPPGTVDLALNPDVNGVIYALAFQPDGKMLLGGDFTAVAGIPRNRVARVNADGSLDAGFNPNANALITCLHVQQDGKILIGGDFTTVGAVSRNRIARLNHDGSLDLGFNPDANGGVRSIVTEEDGQLLVGGFFTTIAGASRNRLARLNGDGEPDAGFNPNVNGNVYSLQLAPDGKIVLGGIFTSVGGVGRNRIAKIDALGNLDTGFNPNASAAVQTCMILSNGRILLGGSFTAVAGVARNRIALLEATGNLVSTFNPGADSLVVTASEQCDGKLLLGGQFTNVGGLPRTRIARLNADGSVDTSFSAGANGTVFVVSNQEDGRMIAAGSFTTLGGESRSRIGRMANDQATESLTVLGRGHLRWLRGGSSQEAWRVGFEVSYDQGASWADLGNADRIGGGWEMAGMNLSGTGVIRARARLNHGVGGGSAGLLESEAGFVFLTPIQQWKQLHLGDADAPDLEDPDQDGLSTLAEYALGTLPHQPSVSPLVVELFDYPDGKRLRALVPRDPSRNDITVEVQFSGDLEAPWTIAATSTLGGPFVGPGYVGGEDGTPGLKSVEIRDETGIPTAPRRVVRLKITR